MDRGTEKRTAERVFPFLWKVIALTFENDKTQKLFPLIVTTTILRHKET